MTIHQDNTLCGDTLLDKAIGTIHVYSEGGGCWVCVHRVASPSQGQAHSHRAAGMTSVAAQIATSILSQRYSAVCLLEPVMECIVSP